ncbi:IS110 family transposase [Xylanimonas allomyrinae]|uniref:IS110 family transposase n=1 Tax=Xylanimonas allomyrinae TaxID=2509459 RepID=A0A4P6EKV5_9MICO|nr:IS110 family transposase [Xylanimonas allomyrinae]QAY62796.1 IS110 family transposase [Xylanimonas allomyrinae]
MFKERTSVGLDVHARSVVAAAIDGQTGEVLSRRLTPAYADVVTWLAGLPGPVAVTYEAGPTGFGLYRALTGAGIECVVAAPSKLQRPAGDRVKTDARDALHLAKLLRLGEVTAVEVPTVEREAARDLVRAREDVRADLMRARHRLSKMLLRHGIVYSGGRAWTQDHDYWLRRQRFDQRAAASTFDAYYDTVKLIEARRDVLDKEIVAMAGDGEYTAVTNRLCALRGIATLTGFALAVEIGDWHRFSGRTIGAFLGLVPTEYSSGASRSQGEITKTGNAHVRRLLVEAAWHHRTRYAISAHMLKRWEQASPAVRARADAGNRRLHQRWVTFADRKKRSTVACVGVARELAGWCWSLATLEE